MPARVVARDPRRAHDVAGLGDADDLVRVGFRTTTQLVDESPEQPSGGSGTATITLAVSQ